VLQLLMEKGYDRYLNYEAPNPRCGHARPRRAHAKA